jgi:hypothetical protein
MKDYEIIFVDRDGEPREVIIAAQDAGEAALIFDHRYPGCDIVMCNPV